jgi:hypothetical protein
MKRTTEVTVVRSCTRRLRICERDFDRDDLDSGQFAAHFQQCRESIALGQFLASAESGMCLCEDDLTPPFMQLDVHRFGEQATISLHATQGAAQRGAEPGDVAKETHYAQRVRRASSDAELWI